MDFLEKVEQYIREKTLFSKEDRVFVACSGGVDSLTLLYCLHALGYRVAAGHVHHGLRQTAGRDEAHVKEWAEARGIPCYTARVDVPARVAEKGESVEEAARNLRYEALLSLAWQAGCSVIALAQHADDHLETVLFHLIRGSGIRGVCGMAPKTVRRTQNSGHFSAFLVRPFLFATKEEITAYAANIGLTWVEDETNQNDDYTRNRLRHTVLPALKEIRKDSAEKALETAEILSSADEYLRQVAEHFLEETAVRKDGAILLPCEAFSAQADIIQQYVLRETFTLLSVPLKDKTRRHIEILRELFRKQSGAECILPGGLQAQRSQDYVRIFLSMERKEKSDVEESSFGSLRIVKRPAKKDEKIPDSLYTKWVDCDKIKGDLFVRGREKGDRISFAAGVRKKLQDYFVDEKIPAEDRDRIPVVTDGTQVVWIVGHRLSADVYVTPETKTIMEITYEEREQK